MKKRRLIPPPVSLHMGMAGGGGSGGRGPSHIGIHTFRPPPGPSSSSGAASSWSRALPRQLLNSWLVGLLPKFSTQTFPKNVWKCYPNHPVPQPLFSSLFRRAGGKARVAKARRERGGRGGRGQFDEGLRCQDTPPPRGRWDLDRASNPLQKKVFVSVGQRWKRRAGC